MPAVRDRRVAIPRLPKLDIGLSVDLTNPDVFDDEGIEERVRAMLLPAGQAVAEYVRHLWVRVAQQQGAHDTGAYIAGIRDNAIVTVEPAGEDESGLAEVVITITNTARHASIVEDGHAAFHLPTRINWSGPRVKQGKNGPYMHIPFRHSAFATPDQLDEKGYTVGARRRMMPADVYALAKRLHYTTRRNIGPIHTSSGQFVAADRYQWGNRLARGHVRTGFIAGEHGLYEERRGPRQIGRTAMNPEWKTSRFEGMFKSGAKGHASYMTIRTITPHSSGWNIPAQVGKGIARTVQASLSGDSNVQTLFDEALLRVIEGG